MDIDDDILASVLSSGSLSTTPQEKTSDLQALARAWVAEKCAPELLPWPAELMGRVLERVQRQIERVEEQTGDMDPKINFQLIIVQTELERFKFLIRSFLRTRLSKGESLDELIVHLIGSRIKLDRHAPYYLNLASNHTSSSSVPLLSPSELQYATLHQSLLSSHYHASFLSAFPPQLQRLDDTAGGISMVEGPDLDSAVFVRCLRDHTEPVVVGGTDIAFEMSKGDVYVVRWSAVREMVGRGEAELI